jgi:hypothetical protein
MGERKTLKRGMQWAGNNQGSVVSWKASENAVSGRAVSHRQLVSTLEYDLLRCYIGHLKNLHFPWLYAKMGKITITNII